MSMREIAEMQLISEEAALWFLGQSGFVFRAGRMTVVIDPYLGDSVRRSVPELTRRYAPPIEPADLRADLYIVTHNHLDHLDPDTIGPYRYKRETIFVSPRLAAQELASLGIPDENLVVVDTGISKEVCGIAVEGVYTIPNDPQVIDASGYKLTFPNGRSVYHSSDTSFSDLLLEAVPKAEVALVCINGKSGNMNPYEAAQVAQRAEPIIALPHHNDMFELNSEHPRSLAYQLSYLAPTIKSPELNVMSPVIWDGSS